MASAAPPSPSGFRIGLQSYSLRGLTTNGKADIDKALAATKDLGVAYWEAYAAHIPIDARRAAEFKKRCLDQGVTVGGHGVNRFTKNHDANKAIFEFASALGVGYLSADPDPDSFDSLDKLVAEYHVAIGIHPHGPGHRWNTIDKMAAAIKDHHEAIGCCVDTGHLLRSREDPVRAVEVFGKRVYGVHLKDVKDATTFTELGKGDLRTVDLLKALAKNGYDYCLAIEYEEHPENPIDGIKECLEATRKAAAMV
jgi:sugar phosphate isomerase/epimerase